MRQAKKSLRLGVIGCGPMGVAIGSLWAAAGHTVTFAYSRDPEKPARVAARAGHGARGGTIEDVVNGTDAILFAAPWSQLDEVLAEAGSLRDRLLIDCSLPMNAAGTDLTVGWQTSGAEQLARATGAVVVKAFNTVPAEFIAANRLGVAASLFITGDAAFAKTLTASLVADCGFEAVDAGPLRVARHLEPFALLMGQLAYLQRDRPEVGYALVEL